MTLTTEQRRELDVMILKLKSGAMPERQRTQLQEASALSMCVDERLATCDERMHLALKVCNLIRSNSFLMVVDILTDYIDKLPAKYQDGASVMSVALLHIIDASQPKQDEACKAIRKFAHEKLTRDGEPKS